MKIFFVALISICLSVAAQFALKTGMTTFAIKDGQSALSVDTLYSFIKNPWLISGFALYGFGAIVWLAVLAKWDVSKAYPLVGFGFALTAVIGFFAGENVTFYRIFGIFLICSGVLFVSNS